MLKSQLATMTEKRALEKDPIEDGMALYRQQALIVSRKKDACAEKLAEIRQEYYTLDAELKVRFKVSNVYFDLIRVIRSRVKS